MKTTILSILLCTILTSVALSQSLRGNAKLHSTNAPVESERSGSVSESKKVMKYGNVEAYDEDNNLVGSVLTDEFGNYKLSFEDSGTYNIKIMYAGYEPIEESITIKGEEESDFSLKRDKYKETRSLSEAVYSMEAGFVDGRIYLSNINAQNSSEKSGKGLTAGEINDFGKWNLWNDYLKDELLEHQKTWKLNPQQRYMVQLLNYDKSPLVGATVQLFGKSNKIIWQSKTDNSGKAELWGSIDGQQYAVDKIVADYQGNKKQLRNPKPFKKGINTIQLEESCGAHNLVEIAFVVDATGSMSDEINFIKRDLNKVMYDAQNMYSDVRIRYGSVFYRDSSEDYVTRHKDFTNVLSEALVFIDNQFAKGGGDMPEAVDIGLEDAIHKLSWSENTRSKLLFLILDAPAHNKDHNIERLQSLAKEAAKKGIKIIPISGSGINKSGEYLMRSLALCTNGTYLFLTDHSGIGSSHIEPTIDEYEIELLTERLSSIIKANIYYPECDKEEPQYDVDYPDSLVAFTSESGQIYIEPSSSDSLSEITNDTLGTNPVWSTENDPNYFEWKYYPNPTRDYVTVESSEGIDFIFLTDISGKVLQKVDLNNSRKATLYLGDYPVGIYLLRYPVGKQWVTGKVVLLR